MSVAIAIRGLAAEYRRGDRRVEVFHDLELDVAAGEFVVLLGPSGSGKTTLLHLIGGLLAPSGGSLEIDGVDLAALSSRRRAEWRRDHVGLVFQQPNLVPTLSAAENVELPLFLFTLDAAQRRERVDRALAAVGLADRGEHLPAELSGGQEQRVALARAIVHEPPLLLADEPTGNLDAESATTVLDLLAAAHLEHGTTIVMVTHDERAAAYGSRRIRFDKGRVEAAHGSSLEPGSAS
jgi:putative ABC transport system ATP-binding protein